MTSCSAVKPPLDTPCDAGRAAARPAWAQPRGVLLPKSSEGLFGADGGEDSCALGADASNVITADIAEGGHARPADSHITVQGPPRKRGRLASPRATPGFGLTAGAASYCFSYGGSCSVLACEEDEEEGEEATGPCAPLPLPIKIRPPAVVGTALATAYVRAASPLRLPLKRGAAPEEQQGAIELPRGQVGARHMHRRLGAGLSAGCALVLLPNPSASACCPRAAGAAGPGAGGPGHWARRRGAERLRERGLRHWPLCAHVRLPTRPGG